MRRFTLEDGTSAKFWEVEQAGAQVTVRFGRLGTQGQTKAKDLDDEVAAAAHLEKLVAEKLRKGYEEQTGAQPAAPLTAPAPTRRTAAPVAEAVTAQPEDVAPLPVPDEDAWSPPAAWQREVLPIRGVDQVTAPALDVAKAEATLGDRREQARSRIDDSSTPDDLRRAGLRALGEQKRLLRRATEPAPTPLGEAVVAAAVLCDADWSDFERLGPALVTSWWTSYPVELVVQALVELAGLQRTPRQQWQQQPGVQRGSAPGHWQMDALPEALVRVRRLLAAGDEETYARAVGGLEQVVSTPLGLTVAAVLAPTRRDWVTAALAQGPPAGISGETFWVQLLASCQTLDEAELVVKGLPNRWLLHRQTAVLTSLAAHVGAAAAPLLLDQLDDADADTARRVVGLVAAFRDDAAFSALLARLDRKGVSEAVLKGKELQPFRATRLLAEAAAGSGSTARACAALLRAHLAAHPETTVVSEGLRPAARAALEKALPEQDARPVAGPDELPPVLAKAPWEHSRKLHKPIVVNGLAAKVPTTLTWAPGEQEAWRKEPLPWMTHRQSWDQALAKNGWGTVTLLAAAPPEVGRRYLRKVDASETWCDVGDAQGVLSKHELDAVPLVVALARAKPNRAAALLPVDSAEVALLMADWLGRAKSVRPTARTWLSRHPRAAALALVPPALGKPGKERRSAERALRFVAARDRAVVEEAAASYGPEATSGITALLETDPLDVLPVKIPSLPAWLDPHALPPVLLADRSARLPVDAVRRLLTCMAVCEPGEPYAGLEQAMPALDRASLAELAWAALETWRLAGEPARDGWVLHSLGFVGDDETARRLAPLVTAWPKQGGTSKAATGLDVLAAIGTEVALMHLHRISLRAPSKPLRERAARQIDSVAEELELTPEQLADRLVPDMGLDPDGRTVLDYGPRSFVVGFDESLKPYVEEAGSRRPTLPKPGAKDDPELAPAAYARFAALKKDVRTVAADQLRRYEQAMAAQRRWTAEEQRRFFIEHPLLWHLARRLVWAAFDGDGKVQLSFRVAEDRTLADRDDTEVTLPADASVGIAHPLHLDGDLGAWTEVFADYEILQPFPQLGREVLHLTDQERRARTLTRFADDQVETKRLYGLAHRGWERSMAEDGGVQGSLVKQLPGGLVAVVHLDPGIIVGMPDEWPLQKLTSVHVAKAGKSLWDDSAPLPLSDLDDVTASEILRDLTRVAG